LTLHKDTEQSPLSAPTESSDAGPNKPNASPISLKRLAIKGSAWVMFGFGMAQVLRLGGNVVLTRLLTPEVFGIMSIVGALLMGLQMFSDVGLRPNIIQNPRGEEPVFIRTAWSIQVIRGFILASLAAILAWPLAFINGEPSLVLITMVAGLTAIISGFHSTWLLVYYRRMVLNKLVFLDLTGQFLSIVVMVVCAWYFRSVWALVLGSFVGSTVKLVASHTVLSGVPMRFLWEKEAVYELIRFGRWIFISTALYFLAVRLDIFVFGSFAGMTMLGIFVLAKNLSRLVVEALMKLSSTVLLPVYSRLAERSTKALRTRTFKIRAVLLYKDAGWMLQIFAAGAIATAIRATIEPVLLAVGNSFRHMIGTAIILCLQIASMSVGAILAGVPGFVVGMALTDWLYYPVLAYLIRPYGVWLPFLDAVAFGSSVVVIGLLWWMN